MRERRNQFLNDRQWGFMLGKVRKTFLNGYAWGDGTAYPKKGEKYLSRGPLFDDQTTELANQIEDVIAEFAVSVVDESSPE